MYDVDIFIYFVNINWYLLSVSEETPCSDIMTSPKENAKAVRSVHEFGLVIQTVKRFQCEIEQTKPQHVTRVFHSTTARKFFAQIGSV
jgi:hypothetical protein